MACAVHAGEYANAGQALAGDELDRDIRPLLADCPRPNANLDIHVQRVQEPFQTLLAEARQLAPHQVGHLRRRNREHFRGAALRPVFAFNNVSNAPCEFRLRQSLVSLRAGEREVRPPPAPTARLAALPCSGKMVGLLATRRRISQEQGNQAWCFS